MTHTGLLEVALLCLTLGMLAGCLVAAYWRALLNRLDRLLPPRHLRRAGTRCRSEAPLRKEQP
ncbi:cellulose biosynthesis protein BcsF [Stutzerimonas balearica]|jgi:hypothetical protein|uniref:cellulose biosynthesis protein BcsF n=1 Tax=Stutzerimonas balearica TaxID=74829 RepID=UPI0013F444D5|nr:cellulose biosynthesis protein BcsF [Stutzerimonas balearica]QII99315.1 cellulose biosynthesis protein BcsF [Stutzerimonas balearica]